MPHPVVAFCTWCHPACRDTQQIALAALADAISPIPVARLHQNVCRASPSCSRSPSAMKEPPIPVARQTRPTRHGDDDTSTIEPCMSVSPAAVSTRATRLLNAKSGLLDSH